MFFIMKLYIPFKGSHTKKVTGSKIYRLSLNLCILRKENLKNSVSIKPFCRFQALLFYNT
jgi:hypothetical protein